MQSTFKTFIEVLDMIGARREIDYSINFTTATITLLGSEIIFKDLAHLPSDPNYDRLGSIEITSGFIDEAVEVNQKAKDVLKTRVRYKLEGIDRKGNPYKLKPKLLLTCNPSKGWVYNEFYKPHKENTLPSGKVFIPALVRDNPFIPQQYISNLEELDEGPLKQRLYYGNWEYEDDPSALLEVTSIEDAYTNQYIQPSPNRYISADVAFLGSDKFVITVWYGMVVKEVYAMDKSDHQQVIRTIQSMQVKHRVRMSNTVFDGDGTGNYVGSFLRGAVSFKNGGTPKHPRKNDLVQYKNLKSQCYFKLADCINRGEILIEDEAYKDKIIEELSSIRNHSHGTDMKLSVMPKEKWKELLGRSPDFADSFMMRMYFEVGKQNKNGRVLNKY